MKRSCQTTQAAMLDCLAPTQLAAEHHEHLEHCSDCQELWAGHSQALALGDRLQTQRATWSGSTDQVYQRLQARATRREPASTWGASLWSSPWAWAAGAAVFVLAVWAQLSFGPSQPMPRPAQTTANQGRPAKPAQVVKTHVSPHQEAELKRLMLSAFALMDTNLGQGKLFASPTLPEEKAAFDWDKELADDAKYSLTLALRAVVPELRGIDPSPISQRIPPSLSAFRSLAGAATQREL